MRLQRVVDKVVRILVETYRPDRIVLFGSAARAGDAAPGDLDLLVIARSERPRDLRITEVAEELAGLPCPIDVVFLTPAEAEAASRDRASLVATALAHGREVYRRLDRSDLQ